MRSIPGERIGSAQLASDGIVRFTMTWATLADLGLGGSDLADMCATLQDGSTGQNVGL